MVTQGNQDTRPRRSPQGSEGPTPEPNKINASTPYDFAGKNLTPAGALLPVITMLEKLDFQALVEQTVTAKRIPRVMDLYRFVLGIVLGLYVGFPRLNQLRFIARDPILTGILKVTKLPVQSTFWRFVNALHGNVARQILTLMRTLRERVWAAANVKSEVVTLDTDTTVHTIYGQQMGGRKAYNPKNKGKRSYQPMLTFIAETREYLWGELRNGDRPSGQQIGDHIRKMCAALPPCVKQIFGRADAGFYCGEAVEAYEEFDAQFVISARKTARLVEQLCQAEWKPSPKTDAGWECEFRYQPDGWKKANRFVAQIGSRRARRRDGSSNCVKPSGSPRPRRTRDGSVNFAISRTGGRRPIGSWPCATRKPAKKGSRKKPSSTSCSKPASTNIESL